MSCPACDHACPTGVEACPGCALDLSNGIRRRSVLAGRYEVLGFLGAGTVATVYRAVDRQQDTYVAVKVLRPDVRRSPPNDSVFRSDLTIAQRIRHRNFCSILDCGEHAGLLYLVMECVSGLSLKQRLKEGGARGGLGPDEAFDLGVQLAAGLQAVHEAGLLHQDIKPQNVIVDDRGLARLMDIDVAKRWGSPTSITITAVGQLFAAAEYVSPEHVRGVKCDARSDIYSLGCVLYEMFTGHPPYRAASKVATALKHVHEPIPLEGPRARRLPEAMVPVMRKVLAKNPARRHPTARALASALALARTMSGPPPRMPPKAAGHEPLPVLLGALNPVDATIRFDLADLKLKDTVNRRAIPVLIQALGGRGAPPTPEPAPLEMLLDDHALPEPVSVGPEGNGAGEDAAQVIFTGSPGSIGILVEALGEKDGNVRAKAARALGGLGPAAREAIPVLLSALQDREAQVRWDAARALGQIGAAAAEGLAAAVSDKDPVVRQIAADALKLIIRRKREIRSAE